MQNHFLPHLVEKAVIRLFEDLSTPVSLKVSLLWRAGDWDQIASLAIDPRHYLDHDRYRRDAIAVSIVRKLVTLPTTIDRKAVAESNFSSCERQCFASNLRLLPYLSPGQPETDEGVSSFFKKARKICSSILGSTPDYVMGRFGPGATYGDRGSRTTVPDKMSSVPTITRSAWPYHFQWLGTLWADACNVRAQGPTYVDGNRFTTVPKDCTKDRGIAVEPSINLFYQLGFGRVIRSRLKRAGINLSEGQDVHRALARTASISGDLATLDLSNASDTVCSNLVKLVLPPDWFECLDDLRSKKTFFRSRWHLLEKFSSMGNGFTFELETLIFLCLILALNPAYRAGSEVHVFGDDIIVPSDSSKAVISMLAFCGMSVNVTKSFVDGPFRESCGGDYFLGVDVRPHFLKESPDEPQQLISLINGIRRLYEDSDPFLSGVRDDLLYCLPSRIRRCRGPKDLGDIVIHDRESLWPFKWSHGIRYLRCYRPSRFRFRKWSEFSPEVTLACACYGTGQSQSGVSPRDSVTGHSLAWVPFS